MQSTSLTSLLVALKTLVPLSLQSSPMTARVPQANTSTVRLVFANLAKMAAFLAQTCWPVQNAILLLVMCSICSLIPALAMELAHVTIPRLLSAAMAL